ncbi:hypothetical protein [Actinophytocola sp. NPDC049390]|uniref:hypothetical protein n=1 Tax=Actinophytocola sp. NPDC049390 TaxID=3363894 RepID=UPI0037A96338
MQNRPMPASPTRFDVGVACAVSVPFGIAALFLVGLVAFFLLPVTGPAMLVVVPALLYVAAAAGVWLLVRGSLASKGFGAGVLTGWVLFAIWSSGLSTGFGGPS